jgi:DNA polymerase-3 subunit delta
LTVTSIQKKLKQNQLSSIYLLYGSESFLIEETKEKIIQSVLPVDERDFNLSVYDMEEVPVETAIEDAETLPFLGEKRIVILQNTRFLTGAKDKTKIEHNLKRLEAYLEDPVPHSILIILAPYEKLDERKKIVKLLKKGEVLQANQLNEKAVFDFLLTTAQEAKIKITKDAGERMIHLLGSELSLLVQEIHKMALYVGENGTVNEEIVDSLTPRTLESNVFALVDHVVHRRFNEAFTICSDLLKQNEEPIKIMALLGRQFRIIFQTKELQRQGYSERQIASQLKLHPYAVKLAGKQGKTFNEQELKQILDQLADADYAMKTGKMEKRLVMELFITKLHKT